MKAQCDRCREIVALEFTVGDGGIDVTCPACAVRYFVAGAGAAPAPQPSAPQPSAPQPPPAPSPPNLPPAPPGAAEAFVVCEETWDDDAPHDDFLSLCAATGSYAYAAARYRHAANDPVRAARAQTRLKQIRTLAEQALLTAVRAEPPIPRGHTLRWIAIALFVVLLGIGIYLYLRR